MAGNRGCNVRQPIPLNWLAPGLQRIDCSVWPGRMGAYSHAGSSIAGHWETPVVGLNPASSRIIRKSPQGPESDMEYHAITDDEIMQVVRYQHMAATYVIANALRRKWKRLPTAYVRSRLRRLEAAGQVKVVPGYYALQLSWSPVSQPAKSNDWDDLDSYGASA